MSEVLQQINDWQQEYSAGICRGDHHASKEGNLLLAARDALINNQQRELELVERHAKAYTRIKQLEAALKPFATFNDAWKEWRCAPNGYLLQKARNPNLPVHRWIEPSPPPGITGTFPEAVRKIELFPSDFEKAAQLLAGDGK